MSTYGIPLHKFITKPTEPIEDRNQPASVRWNIKSPRNNPYPIRQRGGQRFEVFSQKDITIQPTSTKTLVLGLGVTMSRGVCLVTLREDIKRRRCSLQDETISEDVDDIIIAIQNNSDSDVTINEGESLCYVNYRE